MAGSPGPGCGGMDPDGVAFRAMIASARSGETRGTPGRISSACGAAGPRADPAPTATPGPTATGSRPGPPTPGPPEAMTGTGPAGREPGLLAPGDQPLRTAAPGPDRPLPSPFPLPNPVRRGLRPRSPAATSRAKDSGP